MKKIPIIHVHTQADESTAEFINFMFKTMRDLSNHPGEIDLTMHCMSNEAMSKFSAENTFNATLVKHPATYADKIAGSMGHAICIMQALQMMTKKDDIYVICDSDTVVVKKGWDDYIRIQINQNGIGMIGTTYEDIGGFSSGSGLTQTYKKAPTFSWAAFNPKHRWETLDITPDKSLKIPVTTQELSNMYGVPVGYSIFGEAGWQVPVFLHENKIPYIGLFHKKGSKDAVVLKGLDDYHEEYQIIDGLPLVVHQRGSMRHPYRSPGKSRNFYNAVDAYLEKEKDTPPLWLIHK